MRYAQFGGMSDLSLPATRGTQWIRVSVSVIYEKRVLARMGAQQIDESRVGKIAGISGTPTKAAGEAETGGAVSPLLREGVLSRAKMQPLACGADEAALFSNQVRYHEADDDRAHLILVPAEDLMRDIIGIEKVMVRLVAAKAPLFRWPLEAKKPKARRMGNDNSPPKRGPARLAADFLSILRPDLIDIRSAFPADKHRLHPLVELFEQRMERCGFWLGFKPASELDVHRLNACVEAMRQEAKSKAFRRRLDGHLKQVRDNTRSALELIVALYAVYSQLVVVRIDLSYRRHPRKGWLALPVYDGNARGHRGRFIHYLMRKCPCRPVGYVWKTEWAEHTGWHTHMLLFFDGNEHRQDITIARMLGKHWNNEITRGDGRHHISNLDQHQSSGVGKIRYDAAAKLWALCTIVVPYVTKADYYIRFVVPPKTRTFARSKVPEVPAKKLGRPRLNASARVLTYTGSLNRPGYSNRRPDKGKPKHEKGGEQAHHKYRRAEPIPYRSLSKEEYEAKAREYEALGKDVWSRPDLMRP